MRDQTSTIGLHHADHLTDVLGARTSALPLGKVLSDVLEHPRGEDDVEGLVSEREASAAA